MTQVTELPNFSEVSDTYEHPFGERVKLFLRLEIIFKQAISHKSARGQYETQMCLDALFALLNLTNRYELRSVMLRELDRINSTLLQLKHADDVNLGKVDDTLHGLGHCKSVLHSLDSKHIDRIRNIEFLNTIKLRNIHETGSYLFEIPELRYWLLQNSRHREKQIEQWLTDFMPFKETTDFLLNLIRNSAEREEVIAQNGIYIKTVDTKHTVHQLLQICMHEKHNVYPSVSGDGYRFVIRFMQQKEVGNRATQTKENIHFRLRGCGI
ncbi:MAG: cell division protein ZapD [Ostreibacterium sp.]